MGLCGWRRDVGVHVGDRTLRSRSRFIVESAEPLWMAIDSAGYLRVVTVPRDPSIQSMFICNPKVYRYSLHRAIWIPRVRWRVKLRTWSFTYFDLVLPGRRMRLCQNHWPPRGSTMDRT